MASWVCRAQHPAGPLTLTAAVCLRSNPNRNAAFMQQLARDVVTCRNYLPHCFSLRASTYAYGGVKKTDFGEICRDEE